jgi:hypothetical protein
MHISLDWIFGVANIRDVLGEDFLERFDMLIDNAHNLLCLDESAAMRAEVKGSHIALVEPAQTQDGAPLHNVNQFCLRHFDANCARK